MIYAFHQYKLDTQLYELRRNGELCPLEPQVFDVLRYLIEHRDHVVTKDELLANIWPGRIVSDSALTSRLKKVRQALCDNGREQRFIKTLHGRGYRFVGTLDERRDGESEHLQPTDHPGREHALARPEAGATSESPSHPLPRALGAPMRTPALLGRTRELELLNEWLRAASAGEPQFVFIEGEAGIGKTTLIRAFFDHVRTQGKDRACVGQCFEQGATGEAYMPVLDALGTLCSGPNAADVIGRLKECAPSWLLQLPGVTPAAEHDDLARRVIGVTRERMLREFAAAVTSLSASAPLVMVFEDLHWCDPSTLNLLGWLARRTESMRLLILCSYRPGQAPEYSRALAETVYGLRLRSLARVLSLRELDPAAIDAYLGQRFPGCSFPPEVVAGLHKRTEGHPLFLCSVVDGWVDKELVVPTNQAWRLEAAPAALVRVVPDNLRLLIEQQFDQLDTRDRELLEAASVAGPRFSSALIETVLEQECEACERQLTALTESGVFIARDGESRWADGTVASQFCFRHTLYREILYAAIPVRRRIRMHAQIGHRLEQAFLESTRERSVELAVHFSAGAQYSKAIDYRLAAAQQTFGRGGYREAIEHLQQALQLLAADQGLEERDSRELGLRMLLGTALIQTNGWGDPDAEAALNRALALAHELNDRRLPSVLYSIASMYELRGEYCRSQEFLEEQQALPDPFENPVAALESYELLACSMYHQGAFAEALEHAEAGLAAGGTFDLGTKLYVYGENPCVSCHNWAGLALWFLGYPDQALERIEAALALARKPARRYSLSNALCQAATLFQLRREPEAALGHAEEAVAVALEDGFTYPLAVGQILEGWALAVTGHGRDGINLIEQGLAGHRNSGAHMDRPYYLGLLAEAYALMHEWEKAQEILDEALAQIDCTRRFFHQAELLRLKAHLAVSGQNTDPKQAEQLLVESLETAVRQGNRIAQLRAEKELTRMSRGAAQQRKHKAALRRTYESFAEGLDTPDLSEARAVLG